MNKRTFIKTGAMAGLAGLVGGNALSSCQTDSNAEIVPVDIFANEQGEYILPDLPFAYDALEPHIDKQTLELHHDKHHAGYVKGVNNATQKIKTASDAGDFSLIKHWERELAFHGAGHFLHTVYWNSMSPDKTQASQQLSGYINKSFGSMEKFKKYFFAATKSVEASGWGILAYQAETDKLVVLQAEKHQNLSQWANSLLMVCDVWEHAYYLKYQNKRGDYINNFMEIINWDNVSKRLANLTK